MRQRTILAGLPLLLVSGCGGGSQSSPEEDAVRTVARRYLAAASSRDAQGTCAQLSSSAQAVVARFASRIGAQFGCDAEDTAEDQPAAVFLALGPGGAPDARPGSLRVGAVSVSGDRASAAVSGTDEKLAVRREADQHGEPGPWRVEPFAAVRARDRVTLLAACAGTSRAIRSLTLPPGRRPQYARYGRDVASTFDAPLGELRAIATTSAYRGARDDLVRIIRRLQSGYVEFGRRIAGGGDPTAAQQVLSRLRANYIATVRIVGLATRTSCASATGSDDAHVMDLGAGGACRSAFRVIDAFDRARSDATFRRLFAKLAGRMRVLAGRLEVAGGRVSDTVIEDRATATAGAARRLATESRRIAMALGRGGGGSLEPLFDDFEIRAIPVDRGLLELGLASCQL